MSSDWELWDGAKRGDETAWRELVREHHSRLLALALLITGSPDAAKDVAQEAFTRLLEFDAKHRRGSIGGLLATIAYRLALKARARASRQTELADHDLPGNAPSALENLIARERDRQIAAVIQALDHDHRDALALRFYGGHSYKEIADLTGAPLGTVKSRLFYAVKECQRKLREKGILE